MPRKKTVVQATESDENLSKKEAPAESAKLGKPFWGGSITFGLVNVPVKLFAAVREKTVRFHMLHDKDQVRVQQKLICPTDNKEISRDETVKGYEIARGQHVVVDKDELTALKPKEQHAIELLSFVDMGHVDPIYFDRPFYVLPGEKAGKAYHLLLEALKESGKAGIGKFVMRDKEYMAAIRPVGNVLCLETMHFADEIIQAEDVVGSLVDVKAKPAEIAMAKQLVESLAAEFDPALLKNDYRAALMELINKKAAGGHVTQSPEAEETKPGEVIDLMAALEKSLADAKKSKSRKVA